MEFTGYPPIPTPVSKVEHWCKKPQPNSKVIRPDPPANPCIYWDFLELNESKKLVQIKKRITLRPGIYNNSFMNKAELVSKIAEDAGITKAQAGAALESFFEGVSKTLKKGDKLTLVGFGTFSVSKRAARVGRNPQTGETIKIKAKKVARFKPGKELTAKL